MSNLDKDIKILKEFIKKDFEPWSFYEKQGDELFELQEAIENVLKELDKLKESNKDLVSCAKGQSEKISTLNKELSTYKKIAEKLAKKIQIGIYRNIDKPRDEICVKNEGTDICLDNPFCIQCIIDWARKEVEKDEK